MEYRIGKHTYCGQLPALDYEHAKRMADAIGAATGSTLESVVTACNAREVMNFVATLCHEAPEWQYGAEEQLEAYLNNGFDVPPASPV